VPLSESGGGTSRLRATSRADGAIGVVSRSADNGLLQGTGTPCAHARHASIGVCPTSVQHENSASDQAYRAGCASVRLVQRGKLLSRELNCMRAVGLVSGPVRRSLCELRAR